LDVGVKEAVVVSVVVGTLFSGQGNVIAVVGLEGILPEAIGAEAVVVGSGGIRWAA